MNMNDGDKRGNCSILNADRAFGLNPVASESGGCLRTRLLRSSPNSSMLWAHAGGGKAHCHRRSATSTTFRESSCKQHLCRGRPGDTPRDSGTASSPQSPKRLQPEPPLRPNEHRQVLHLLSTSSSDHPPRRNQSWPQSSGYSRRRMIKCKPRSRSVYWRTASGIGASSRAESGLFELCVDQQHNDRVARPPAGVGLDG